MTERDWLFVGCEREHDMRHVGGCNAGCDQGNDCGCSVPVFTCARCGNSDYGDNEEATFIRERCAARREMGQ
jgi:hypothetical protein